MQRRLSLRARFLTREEGEKIGDDGVTVARIVCGAGVELSRSIPVRSMRPELVLPGGGDTFIPGNLVG